MKQHNIFASFGFNNTKNLTDSVKYSPGQSKLTTLSNQVEH